MEFKGACNLPALFSKLQAIMIRRRKVEVLTQLPEKRRQFVPMEMNGNVLEPVAAMRDQLKQLKRDSAAFGKLWGECLQRTGIAKVPMTIDYLNDLLEGGSKVLLFAHHIKVLDAIEQELFRQKIGHIRIDGSVSPSDRQLRCKDFQSSEHVRVAVLGLLAAGQGITLTAADTVLFAEMSVTPGVMLQSEDRAHRIGQRSSVNIHYLVAKGTIDEDIWRMIGNKLSNLGLALDGKTAKLGAQHAATLSHAIDNAVTDNSTAQSCAAVDNSTGTATPQKAAVFSIFDRKRTDSRQPWPCPSCTLLNVARSICAACGASCPKVPGISKTPPGSSDRDCHLPAQADCGAFCGSFSVSKNTQRLYVFGENGDLIGTITPSQLEDDDASHVFPQYMYHAVTGFLTDFCALRPVQQRQLSDCILKPPLSARVNELLEAERCRSSSTNRHSTILPFERNGDVCGMCGKGFDISAIDGRFCSGSCKKE
jgi:hypothetical protein